MKDIALIIFSVLFLISATGVVVFHIHCTCTGEERVSVYLSPETCVDNYHVTHSHSKQGDEADNPKHLCNECTAHTDNCGCNEPDVSFFQLEGQVLMEKVRLERINPVVLNIPETVISYPILSQESNNAAGWKETGSPPVAYAAFDFLISIHQLKILPLA